MNAQSNTIAGDPPATVQLFDDTSRLGLDDVFVVLPEVRTIYQRIPGCSISLSDTALLLEIPLEYHAPIKDCDYFVPGVV